MLDLGVEADATVGIVGEGDAYTGFQHLACDVGHFAGCATRDDDSCVFPDRQADKPFFKVAVTSHAMATKPKGPACFPSVAVWPRSQPSTPR
ncbi:hypothetical protein [Mesorhizobium carmichaelinearum]|uniref:hypothetical protein n=1 Tax=Mesorhizobium carmichaelinearum TaxID=1208188 RepID=UPI00117E8B0D|nr:hypothetical protein [Mesorhizobium carmichaelinearum]